MSLVRRGQTDVISMTCVT